MRCLDCDQELEPGTKDHTILVSEYTIIRFVRCSCGSENALSYDSTGVVSSHKEVVT